MIFIWCVWFGVLGLAVCSGNFVVFRFWAVAVGGSAGVC